MVFCTVLKTCFLCAEAWPRPFVKPVFFASAAEPFCYTCNMKRTTIVLALLCMAAGLYAQPYMNRSRSSAEIYLMLKKLSVCGNVLYVAAHPDDENTRMLTYFAREKSLETSYLSLTRGDGGQNLIGTEQSEELGIIRTQELLAARNIDGAKQYFTRALDFGFSKNPQETFGIWDRNTLLGDVVFMIRYLKPDVIVTRFSPVPGPTHGHHTASAQLALEAFSAAADPKRYPEQLTYVQPHQVKRIYWNTSWFFFGNKDYDKTGLLSVDIGKYNPQLGVWYGEMAAESRSMHRSQGFGSARQRGSEIEYLKYLGGDSAATDLFEGIDLSWNRVPGAKGIDKSIAAILSAFSFDKPYQSVPALVALRRKIKALPESSWKTQKLAELDEIILQCSGIFAEALLRKYEFAANEDPFVQLEVLSSSPQAVRFEIQKDGKSSSQPVKQGEIVSDSLEYKASGLVSTPYWLRNGIENGFFVYPEPFKVLPYPVDQPYSIPVTFWVEGEPIVRNIPLIYKKTQPDIGETYRYPVFMADMVLNANKPVVFSTTDQVTFHVTFSANRDVSGMSLRVKNSKTGQEVFRREIQSMKKGGMNDREIRFTDSAAAANRNSYRVEIWEGERQIAFTTRRIEYPHIPAQTIQNVLEVPVCIVKNVPQPTKRIGYIEGAGDKLPDALLQLAYKLEYIKSEDFTEEKLQRYDVIICGIRAYNTRNELVKYQPLLMDYVKNGGRLIVQYNTTASLLTKEIGPYKMDISRDRVTDENAAVEILQPAHPLMKGITQADFSDWVQERGLYYPGNVAAEYTPLLRMADPGEKPSDNALLYATYGRGDFIYTGLSFFRQVPAGHAGAMRLFLNFIEAPRYEKN